MTIKRDVTRTFVARNPRRMNEGLTAWRHADGVPRREFLRPSAFNQPLIQAHQRPAATEQCRQRATAGISLDLIRWSVRNLLRSKTAGTKQISPLANIYASASDFDVAVCHEVEAVSRSKAVLGIRHEGSTTQEGPPIGDPSKPCLVRRSRGITFSPRCQCVALHVAPCDVRAVRDVVPCDVRAAPDAAPGRSSHRGRAYQPVPPHPTLLALWGAPRGRTRPPARKEKAPLDARSSLPI